MFFYCFVMGICIPYQLTIFMIIYLVMMNMACAYMINHWKGD
ncbi:Uncharacterised protein [Escherichia coli]|nr:Uncharacterised protein [Escherichia coli]CTV86806.1 Uncharacterised protein [Escherichia coli]CTW01996.1 Uncharacterised protein [Escherichia coli]CTW79215.1 Uncharacterised protein [Escherichia coli]CTX60690.1 Uncharacterised protein [Escherichia coli]